MTTVLTTETVDPAHRFEAWRVWGSTVFAPMSFHAEAYEDFQGALWARTLGPVSVGFMSARAHEIRRDTRLIADHDPEEVWLALQLGGRAVIESQERVAVLDAGDLAVYDSSHPCVVRGDGSFEMAVFQLPRRLTRFPSRIIDRMVGVRVTQDEAPLDLVTPFMLDLVDRLRRESLPEAAEDLGEALLGLTRLLFRGVATEDREELDRAPAPLLPVVKAFIERHLDDPGLTPSSIAAKHGISLRYLHAIFERESCGVAAWTRLRRLERCRQDLGDTTSHELPIQVIAARWGFWDQSQFSRAFKRAYACTPSDYRRRIAAATTAERAI